MLWVICDGRQTHDRIHDMIHDRIHNRIHDIIHNRIHDIIHDRIYDIIYDRIHDRVNNDRIHDMIHDSIVSSLQAHFEPFAYIYFCNPTIVIQSKVEIPSIMMLRFPSWKNSIKKEKFHHKKVDRQMMEFLEV